MDLERLITEPPIGVVESDAPRPIEESIHSVVDDSYPLSAESDQIQHTVDLMLEVLQSARDDFEKSPSDEYLDALVEPLIDAESLSSQQYSDSIVAIRREFASAVVRSFVVHYGNVVGLDYVSPGKQGVGMVRSAFVDFVRLVRESFDRIGSEALKSVVFGFVSGGYQSLYRAWISLESEFVENELPRDPKERQLELKLRDLESRLSSDCGRAYDFGRELARYSPDVARETLRTVELLVALLEAVLRGLDLYLGIVAVRIRVDFRRWERIVKAQFTDLARQEIRNIMSVFGASVIQPVMGLVNAFRGHIGSLERLVGEIPRLELIEHALDQIDEWQRRYYDYIDSLRGDVRESAEAGFQTSTDVVRYSRLWRRRRLCVALLKILRSLRDGLTGGRG